MREGGAHLGILLPMGHLRVEHRVVGRLSKPRGAQRQRITLRQRVRRLCDDIPARCLLQSEAQVPNFGKY